MTDHLDTLDLAALTRAAERLGYVRVDGDASAPRMACWTLRGPRTGALVWLVADSVPVAGMPARDRWYCDDEGYEDDEAAALRWLLRQPEALARAACYARGVADERARIIADARTRAEEERERASEHPYRADALEDFADALERGEHEVTRG